MASSDRSIRSISLDRSDSRGTMTKLSRGILVPDVKVKISRASLGACAASADYEQLPTHDDFEDECPASKRHTSAAKIVPEQEPEEETLLDDTRFQTLMALMIVGNALVIGLETDIPDWEHWEVVENTFLFIFTCELSLKFKLLGFRKFFATYHADFTWNLFDLLIVGLGLFDVVMSLFNPSSGGGCATLFRIIRLLRILRIFRIIKFLKQLYLLAFGLVEAMKAIFWVAILMSFVLYVCSILLVKAVGRLPSNDVNSEFLSFHYGCIVDSMLTLFMLMSNPDLTLYYDQNDLLSDRPLFTVFLIAFITFGSFGIIAMLTGVISESMFEKNEMRKCEARVEHELMRSQLGKLSGALYETVAVRSANGEELTSVETVLELAHSLREMLLASGGHTSYEDVVTMVKTMDTDGDGRICKTELVRTMDKVASGLSPLGLQEVAHEVGVVQNEMKAVKLHLADLAKDTAKLVQMMSCREAKGNAGQLNGIDVFMDPLERKPPQRQDVHVDIPAFIEVTIAKHTDMVRADMAQQCKEVMLSQEKVLQALCKVRSSAMPDHEIMGVGAEAQSCFDLSQSTIFPSSSVKPEVLNQDIKVDPVLSLYGNDPSAARLNTGCRSPCRSYAAAAHIATQRLGLVEPDLMPR